jgi:GNAT superfamily N-acetyltransferase
VSAWIRAAADVIMTSRAKVDTADEMPVSRRSAEISICKVDEAHLAHVIDLDAATRRMGERFFLIAEPASGSGDRPVLGYIVGEVRAWEFGSAPCGWVFAFSVDPRTRLQGIGEGLFEAISKKFREIGIHTMRTMVARTNGLHMAFFRSEGMTAGPYIQLEKELD